MRHLAPRQGTDYWTHSSRCWRERSRLTTIDHRGQRRACGLRFVHEHRCGVHEQSRSEPMKTRAAVAWEAGKPLSIERIELEGPKAGEVLVEVRAKGICHTDASPLSGADSEGKFPAVLGHEGAGV